jgi:hypothetical protein
MKLFYKEIELNVKVQNAETGICEPYSGRVFAGIQFKDQENNNIDVEKTIKLPDENLHKT